MKERDVGIAVSSVVFTPTLVAYSWIMTRYVVAGAILYALSVLMAYKIGLFREIMKWPWVSRVSLWAGPLALGFAVYYATQRPTYWMLVPAMVYAAIVIIGGVTLRGRRLTY